MYLPAVTTHPGDEDVTLLSIEVYNSLMHILRFIEFKGAV